MPITKSAKKALKQNLKKRSRNNHFKKLYREARKSFENAIKNNDISKAKEIFANTKKDGKTISSGLQSIIDKLVKKNIIHKNNWNRKKSKFANMIKKLELSLKS